MAPRIEHLAEGVTLYQGDCRKILPTLGKVDAVVTDPPYEAVMQNAFGRVSIARQGLGDIKKLQTVSRRGDLKFQAIDDIRGARVLVMLGDRVTTDHISPAGAIPPDSPAGRYLLEHGVEPKDFGTYGARRGNHEVMMRGTFANPRIRNLLVEREGGWTVYWPTGELMTVFDAAMKYREKGIPVIVIAGKMYGAGSSRDWAAKGPYLLGVRAVIAESFERIHRSNLVGMGILPLQFMPGENAKTLGLRGDEEYDIIGIREGLYPHKKLTVIARRPDGTEIKFNVIVRLDNEVEVEYYKHGGILQYVLRKLIKQCKEQKEEKN